MNLSKRIGNGMANVFKTFILTFRRRNRLRIIILFCILCFLFGLLFDSKINFPQSYRTTNTLHKTNVVYYKSTIQRSSNVKILLWTAFFGNNEWIKVVQSQTNCNCSLTDRKDEIESADVVVFHYLDLWVLSRLPSYRRHDQVWVLFVFEPPPHIPNIGLYVPRNTFNWTMSYRTDSTVPSFYATVSEKKQKEQNQINASVFVSHEEFSNRRHAVSVISNCFDGAQRYREINELQKYLPIDLFGGCGDQNIPWKDDYINNYKFVIAFENSDCRDYITEKYWSTIQKKVVPIVNWSPNQEGSVPILPHSYINIRDFRNIKEASEFIHKIANNFTLYNSYFHWKLSFSVNGSLFSSFNQLCEKIRSKTTHQVLVDPSFWIQDDTCEMWSISNMFRRRWNRFKFDFTLT